MLCMRVLRMLSLSLAAKKVTKESRRNSDGSNFGGGTIELQCYCGTGLIGSDIFSLPITV